MTVRNSSRPGILFVVCGPSGVGKTTLCRHLLSARERLTLSVSYTTRAPRGAEVDGVAYHFVTTDRFEEMRDQGHFAEWATVHGNYYGTSVQVVEDAWQAGHDLLFDLDYQGARQLHERFPNRTISTLIVPPSMVELEARLRGRGTDSEDVIDGRLRAARHELEQWQTFDFIIANETLADAQCGLLEIYDVSGQLRRVQADGIRKMLDL